MRKTPGPKAAPAKKVKKRNPWSEDESKSESDLEDSQPVIPRETKSQRASGTVLDPGSASGLVPSRRILIKALCSVSASKPKYTFDFSEEEDEAAEEENGDASSPLAFKDTFASSDTKDRYDDDEEDDFSYPPAKQKPT